MSFLGSFSFDSSSSSSGGNAISTTIATSSTSNNINSSNSNSSSSSSNDQLKKNGNENVVGSEAIINNEEEVLKAGNLFKLDTAVVRKICGGQVITNLSSAIKELVENSLDAQATRIEVKLKIFGKEYFEVSDNGMGITKDNYENFMRKSYTSKLSSFDDLEKVTSFGFRGEALASLLELCPEGDIVVSTRTKEENVGMKLTFNRDGSVKSSQPAARPVGTTIMIKNLFKTLPVRRREFERTIKTQYAKLISVLQGYAIISKNVRISCVNIDGSNRRKVCLQTSGGKSIKDNIISICGVGLSNYIVPVNFSFQSEKELKSKGHNVAEEGNDDDDSDVVVEPDEHGDGTGDISMDGYVSKFGEGVGMNSGDRQFWFLNGRPVDFPKGSRIVNQVWRQHEMKHKPAFFLNWNLPPGEFDVNVTPDKREVFIVNENILLIQLKSKFEKIWQRQTVMSQSQTMPQIWQSNNDDEEEEEEEELKDQEEVSAFQAFVNTQDTQDKKPSEIDTMSDKDKDEDNMNDKDEDLNDKDENMIDKDDENMIDKDENMIDKDENMIDKDENMIDKDENMIDKDENMIDKDENMIDKDENVINSEDDDNDSFIVKDGTENIQSPIRNACPYIEEECQVDNNQNNSGKRKRIPLVAKKATPQQDDIPIRKKTRAISFGSVDDNSEKDFEEEEVELVDSNTKKIVAQPLIIPNENIEDIKKTLVAISEKSSKHGKASNKETVTNNNNNNNNNNNTVSTPEKDQHKIIGVDESDFGNQSHERIFSKPDFGKTKIIGQFNKGFIIGILENDIFIFDQHACDEKYRFETLQKTTKIRRQPLIRPFPLDVGAAEFQVIQEHQDIFEANGFKFQFSQKGSEENDSSDIGGKHHVFITAIPHSLKTEFGAEDVRELASHLIDNPPPPVELREKLGYTIPRLPRTRAMFASRACRSATMIGDVLPYANMQNILNNMVNLEQPWNCPHGRPTMRHLTDVSAFYKNRGQETQDYMLFQ